jgi:hypothetical protein
MQFDPQRVLINVRQATTEDLLDRATVYRAGMEPDALAMIDAELRSRGVTEEQIKQHAERRGERSILLPDGTAPRCSFCSRPAVVQAWGWHRLLGLLPIFPREYYYCERHEPVSPG